MRLSQTDPRSREIFTHVGHLCTEFAGLEILLLQFVSRFTYPNNPERWCEDLPNTEFKKTVREFQQVISKRTQDPSCLGKAASLAETMFQIADDRNDIAHSSWIAFSRGDFGQHRARPKGKTPTAETHARNPIKKISQVVDRIDAVISALDDLEEHIE